jgi:hypothetical protein
MDNKVRLEECITSYTPQPLHFDVEIKKKEIPDDEYNCHDWFSILGCI